MATVPKAPGESATVDLDFTGVFRIQDLVQQAPPPPPPKPAAQPKPAPAKPLPKDLMVGVRSLSSKNYFVNLTRPRPARAVEPAKTTILVVEDDQVTRGTLGLVLMRVGGYQVRSANDVHTFVAALQKRPMPDAVILDIELPGGISGFKILAKIRSHVAIRNLPVIIFSGHSEPEDLSRALQLGADAYISKPAKAESILAAVKAVLGG